MDLSSLLVDTYKRYKQGSATVVSWLASSAVKVQNIDHLLVKGPRLKGKARTASRQQDRTSHHAQVSLNVFAALVDILSRAGITMPHDIEVTLWDVVKARKECAATYKAKPDKAGDDIHADEGQEHFAGVLQHFYSTLRPSSYLKEAPSKNYGRPARGNSNVNKFDSLESEELSYFEGVASPTSQASAKQAQPTTYDIERTREAQLQEKAFAVFCFLKDITALRLFVHHNWRDYKERKVCLTTAAMTANIAIEILLRINNAFLEDSSDIDTHNKIVDFLLCVDHQLLNDIRRDSRGWYVLEDFKLLPQTFVCEETLRVCFTNFLGNEKHPRDIVH
jgi:hypothetical protein